LATAEVLLQQSFAALNCAHWVCAQSMQFNEAFGERLQNASTAIADAR
jgi:hypothetical protein